MKLKLEKKDPRFDVPAGVYDAAFLDVETVNPDELVDSQSRFKTNGPRLRFSFEVVAGPCKNKILAQLCSAAATPKSRLRSLLLGLTGGEISEDVEVDVGSFKGKLYRIAWQINPNSPAGNCHIASLFPAPAGAPTAEANGSAPAPAAPKKPAKPKPIGPRFWVPSENGEDELVAESVVQEMVDKVGDASKLRICAASDTGDAIGTYKPANELGFLVTTNPHDDTIPY
jgi:hypothetical protein